MLKLETFKVYTFEGKKLEDMTREELVAAIIKLGKLYEKATQPSYPFGKERL